jgi:glycosyltransferase involved in cell wall biosynthesis
LDDIELLILHRPWQRVSLELMREARYRDLPIVVDIDDLFAADGIICDEWRAEVELAAYNMAPSDKNPIGTVFMEALWDAMRLADAVTVSTPLVAAGYQELNPAVHVLPNCYDETHPLWNLAPPPRQTVHIGFAGSGFHTHNVAPLARVLEAVLEAHPEVRIVEAGGPNLLPELNVPAERLVHLGTAPFEAFPLLLQQMDIVLAPLADVPFNYGKSNVRCLTAGLVGVPVVASPVGAYAEYITHGVNGFLARTGAEWRASLERLVADAALRREMGESNRRRARAYGISANVWRWIEVYEPLLRRRRCA